MNKMAGIYDIIFGSVNSTSLLLAAVGFLVTYLYFKWVRMAPGPIGLPYLGYYPFLSNINLHKELAAMTKKYGDVFCFTITGQTYVHVGSLKAMREALITQSGNFTRKPQNFNLLLHSISSGVLYESGEKWKVLRRFFSQKMKDYGMGKQTQESWLLDSLQRTVDALKDSKGKDFDLTTFFSENCTVAISNLLFGSTMVDLEISRRLAEDFAVVFTAIIGTRLLVTGPLLKYVLLPFMRDLQALEKVKADMECIFQKILRDHEKDFNKNNIRNLVDCYINERRSLQEKGDPQYKIFTEKAFSDTIVQIFGDGSVTIGALAASVLKCISDRPEIQKRMQSEIDEVVGRERFPSWDEKNRMPYTNAVIYETMRQADFLPFFPSLECTEETTVCGCPVPKGSILFINYYAAHIDPRVYDDPAKFDPTRFLPTEDKKPKCELPSIFGMGKRSCLGESLANMETFLFATTVMQNFDLQPASSQDFSKDLPSFADWNVVIRATRRKS